MLGRQVWGIHWGKGGMKILHPPSFVHETNNLLSTYHCAKHWRTAVSTRDQGSIHRQKSPQSQEEMGNSEAGCEGWRRASARGPES